MSMNPRKRDQLIYIRTNYTGFIPELGTAGPIVSPMLCPISRCVKMMSNGVKLIEVDPKSGKTIALTISNIDNPNNFGTADDVPEKFNVENPVVVQTHTETPAAPEVPTAVTAEPEKDPVVETDEDEDEPETSADETEADETLTANDSQLPSNPKMTKAQKKAAKAAKAAEATK